MREIYELSLKTPGMFLFENEKVIIDAIQEGVKNGFVGVKEGTEVYYEQDVSPTMDTVVLRGEVAKEIKQAEKKEKEKIETNIPEKGEEVKKESGTVKSLTFRAKIPWDKFSDVVSGIIRPLKDKGLPPEITIEVRAKTEEGFDRTTLDSKVRETLKQIGGKIEEWKEE